MNEPLYIIDSTSPFFLYHKQGLVNWSKIPYQNLEEYLMLNPDDREDLESNVKKYFNIIKTIGFNAVSIDELSRLIIYDFYPERLKKKISIYRQYYENFFKTAEKLTLSIFITTDFMFYNRSIDNNTGKKTDDIIELFTRGIEKVFKDFPLLEGIIVRIGESDGVDVEGDFKSRIVLKKPSEVNLFLKKILPLFEKHNKKLVFRTWTIGAYKTGDLIWNEKTFEQVFSGINSDNLIISMKYGEHDFFRHLRLNPLFFKSHLKKIVELQARREYEGFGEFPSFTGWDYKNYYERLKYVPGFSGLHLWCQTGGWSRFRNFTFMKESSYWNELNTIVTLKIFKEGLSVEDAVRSYYHGDDCDAFLEFLTLSDQVVKNLLYLPGFARRHLFFNHVRVPPLIHVSWDNVTLTDYTVTMYRYFMEKDKEMTEPSDLLLKKIEEMGAIAEKLELRYNYRFHYDTFELFALCRDLILSGRETDLLKKMKTLLENYEINYPEKYHFHINVSERKRNLLVKLLLFLSVRQRPAYRFIDRLLFNRPMAGIYMLFFFLARNKLPKFVNKQGMPVKAIFM